MTDYETITPIEYVQGGYHERKDVIVWLNDNIVDNVYWRMRETYVHEGYYVSFRHEDNGNMSIDKSACFLRVEPANAEYLRQRLREIIELIDDGLVLETLEELRQCVDWQRERNENG